MSDHYEIKVEFASDTLVVVQVYTDGDVLIFQGGYEDLWQATHEARDAIKRDRKKS